MKGTAAPPGSTAQPPAPDKRRIARRIGAEALLALVLFLGMAQVKHWVDRTASARVLDRAAYALTQLWMGGPVHRDSLPVVVVDLSPIDLRRPSGGTRTELITPREALWNLIAEIARQNPASIGIDVDFSPDTSGWIDPASDPAFFLKALRLSQQGVDGLPRTPVALGVLRGLAERDRRWLGNESFAPLAASLAIRPGDRRQLLGTRVVDDATEQAELPSLGAAVAAPVLERQRERWPAWWRDRFESESSEVLGSEHMRQVRSADLRATDFSQVQNFLEHHVDARAIPAPAEGRLEGRAVLIGDCNRSPQGDSFEVPGQEARHRGVFYHASVAYSLIRGPLLVPRESTSLVIDVVLLVITLGGSLVLQLRHLHEHGEYLETERATALFDWGKAAVFFVLGAAFTASTRILWTDFLLSIPFMVVASWLGRKIAGDGPKLFRSFVHWARGLVRAHPTGGH